MKQEKIPSRLKRILTGLVLLVANLLLGAALGLLWVKLFVPAKSMGWDGIADALGGLMVGALLGLVASVLMMARLSMRAQWASIGVAVVVAALTFAGLALTAPTREASPAPILTKNFEPFYRVSLRVTHTEEILAAVSADERPLPFTEAAISTSKPELIHVGWGPDFDRCATTPSEAELEALLPKIQDAMSVAGPYCRTDEDDLTLSVRWNLAGSSGNQGLEAGCLADQPAYSALADAIGTLAEQLCGAEAQSLDAQ